MAEQCADGADMRPSGAVADPVPDLPFMPPVGASPVVRSECRWPCLLGLRSLTPAPQRKRSREAQGEERPEKRGRQQATTVAGWLVPVAMVVHSHSQVVRAGTVLEVRAVASAPRALEGELVAHEAGIDPPVLRARVKRRPFTGALACVHALLDARMIAVACVPLVDAERAEGGGDQEEALIACALRVCILDEAFRARPSHPDSVEVHPALRGLLHALAAGPAAAAAAAAVRPPQVVARAAAAIDVHALLEQLRPNFRRETPGPAG